MLPTLFLGIVLYALLVIVIWERHYSWGLILYTIWTPDMELELLPERTAMPALLLPELVVYARSRESRTWTSSPSFATSTLGRIDRSRRPGAGLTGGRNSPARGLNSHISKRPSRTFIKEIKILFMKIS